MNSLSDNQLMLNVRDGDLKKLGVLFERHNIALFNFFLRMTSDRNTSEDLVQEVFLRILKYRHTYRGDGKFISWMFHIARNAQIDFFKKNDRESVQDEGANEPVSHHPNPDDSIEQEEETALLMKALSMLSVDKREVLVLSRFQKMKYEEIAELCKCQVGTIKARVHRAIKELRSNYIQLSGEKL